MFLLALNVYEKKNIKNTHSVFYFILTYSLSCIKAIYAQEC